MKSEKKFTKMKSERNLQKKVYLQSNKYWYANVCWYKFNYLCKLDVVMMQHCECLDSRQN